MNFRTHKEKLLKSPKTRKEYEKLGPEFHLAQSLIKARMKKGWTQAELARRVGMQQPNIARLEGGTYDRVLDAARQIAGMTSKKTDALPPASRRVRMRCNTASGQSREP